MSEKQFLIETSARHVHVSPADLDKLFGAGYKLTKKKDLSQPGQFACEERVKVIGPRGELVCTILGPVRPSTQVEISATEARSIGVMALLRESGDIKGTNGSKIVGPKGEITLSEGVIVAKRHVHMTPEDAANFGVKDKDIISVKVGGARGLVFGETVVRVSPAFALAMHVDTDESNAAGLSGEVFGEIVK